MRHLIAKRNRLRGLIAEQEVDPWLIYSNVLMHDMLTDENYALMLAEITQHQAIRRLAVKQMDGHAVDALQNEVKAWDVKIGHMKDGTRYSLNKLAQRRVGRPHAFRGTADHERIVRDRFAEALRDWDKLSDAAKAWLERPHPNPGTALDFPDPERTREGTERALFYPERSSLQEGQLRKLREALAWVEKQIADEPQP